jgi:predicted phosphate transport protein (TIGR00153 family)
MKLLGFGQDLSLFTLLERQAEAAGRAAREFHAMTQDYTRFEQHLARIDEIEHEADDLTHELANKVDATFVTPLDKEDLHAISTALDDITDAIEDATNTLALYRMPALRPDIEPLATLLSDVMAATQEAIGCLRNKKSRESMQPIFIRIHDLEEKADDGHRSALSSLFHAPDRDAFDFISWKEVYDGIETAVDLCEDVTNIVESVVVKYA